MRPRGVRAKRGGLGDRVMRCMDGCIKLGLKIEGRELKNGGVQSGGILQMNKV